MISCAPTQRDAASEISRRVVEMTDFDRHVLGQYYGYLLRRFGKPNYIRGVRRVAKFPTLHKMRLVHRRWQALVECGLIAPCTGAVS
jgi:hypothetical protein